MNRLIYIAVLALIVNAGCQQKSNNEHDHHGHGASDAVETKGNQALYEEVMKVHDEVMPKMNDIYKKKQELNTKLTTVSAEKKKELEGTIAQLDSASVGMMVWMRQFNPIADSVDQEKAREYLEGEMEKVKKVKADILTALEEAEKADKQ